MISALVPPQGEKVVNYPTRPVDTTTDFEGTTSLQPSQPVSSMVYSYFCFCFFFSISKQFDKRKVRGEEVKEPMDR